LGGRGGGSPPPPRGGGAPPHAALVIDGVAALQAGDNPRIVREKLSGYVGPVKAKKGKAAAAPEGAGVPAQAGAWSWRASRRWSRKTVSAGC